MSANRIKFTIESDTEEVNDIDTYIQMLIGKQEVTEFIESGRYPDRLSFKHKKIYMPVLDDISVPEPIPIDTGGCIDKFNTMLETLNNVESELKADTTRENLGIDECENKDNNCPICMNDMGDRNYIVPNCGHRVCMTCVLKNMMINLDNGSVCCLCRRNILSTL
jgi:hypothetical protein